MAKVSVLRAACSLGLGKACKASSRTEGHCRDLEKGDSADPHAGPGKVGQRRLAPEAQRTNALPGRGGGPRGPTPPQSWPVSQRPGHRVN